MKLLLTPSTLLSRKKAHFPYFRSSKRRSLSWRHSKRNLPMDDKAIKSFMLTNVGRYTLVKPWWISRSDRWVYSFVPHDFYGLLRSIFARKDIKHIPETHWLKTRQILTKTFSKFCRPSLSILTQYKFTQIRGDLNLRVKTCYLIAPSTWFRDLLSEYFSQKLISCVLKNFENSRLKKIKIIFSKPPAILKTAERIQSTMNQLAKHCMLICIGNLTSRENIMAIKMDEKAMFVFF